MPKIMIANKINISLKIKRDVIKKLENSIKLNEKNIRNKIFK